MATPLVTPPLLLWTGIAGVMLLAVVAGFAAGLAFAPSWQEWRLKRACRSLKRLYEATFVQIEQSEALCRQLGEFQNEVLAPAQWSRLDDVVRHLQSAWHAVAEKHRPQNVEAAGEPAPFQLEWKREPIDSATGLPDRSALEENLQQLLTMSTASRQVSGVLLVSLDKGDQLQRRFGADVAHRLEARLATVLVKASRDQDLVCRIGPGSFAVLLPCVSPLTGARVAETLRHAVRQHRFRAQEAGPEIMVTASFGFSACLPGDPPTLVLDRAGAALAKSQSCGRNQLHVHDAYHHTVCRIA